MLRRRALTLFGISLATFVGWRCNICDNMETPAPEIRAVRSSSGRHRQHDPRNRGRIWRQTHAGQLAVMATGRRWRSIAHMVE
jgi:hypothetical protein